MKKQRLQFGIEGLFVLTTSVAVCFAVIRLPLHRAIRLGLVGFILLALFLLVTRRIKRPLDPRLGGLIPVALFGPQMAMHLWDYFRMPAHPYIILDYVFLIVIFLGLLPFLWYIVGAVRYAFEPMSTECQAEQADRR